MERSLKSALCFFDISQTDGVRAQMGADNAADLTQPNIIHAIGFRSYLHKAFTQSAV